MPRTHAHAHTYAHTYAHACTLHTAHCALYQRSPLNAGVMAVKPDSTMFEASVWYAANAKFVNEKVGGWDGAGSFPKPGRYIG